MSNEQTVSGGVTRIEIGRAEGELEVLGWDEGHIRIVGLDDDDSSEPEISDGILRLDRLEDDVTISVPRQASLHVLSAKNDLTVRGIQGSIRIDAVSGDVQMQDTGSVSLGAVSGDAHIEGSQGGARLDTISGDLHASRLDRLEITGNINGDTEVRDVSGEVSINRGIHGDAKFHNVGRVTISSISGDCGIVHAGSAY